MDILIVGSDTPGALERYCEAALTTLGHQVTYLDTHAHVAQHARFRQTPVLSEVEFSLLKLAFNRKLLGVVRATHPDLLLVFKGVELNARSLQQLRSMNNRPLIANWNPDSPFDFGTANTNPQIVHAISYYDVYFTWSRDLFDPLSAAGAEHVEYLPFGYDPAHHHPVELSPQREAELQHDVCFVGGYTAERAALLSHLVRIGVDVGVWGTNWQRLSLSSPLRERVFGGWTSGTAMSEIFSAAHIVLNFLRKQNGQEHNMRTFEAPATQSLMLATRTREQMDLLPEDEAAAYFATQDELAHRVRYFLKDAAQRESAATEGYRRIIEGEHTYLDRMKQLTAVVEAL